MAVPLPSTGFRRASQETPKGRPKGAKNKPQVQYDPAQQLTDNMILNEAYRPVTIREGVRALAISAMKGSRLSQRALAELVRTVEDRKTTERMTAMENAFEYKQKWTAELQRRCQIASTEPDLVPHPDDIIIDMRTGHVKTEGPLDEREKRSWDERLARRAEAQVEVNYYAEKYTRAKSPERKHAWREDWHFEQRIFDIINDSLPTRYKTKLENRSNAEGASKQGKALEEFVRDRQQSSCSPDDIGGSSSVAIASRCAPRYPRPANLSGKVALSCFVLRSH